jgi:outer membrane immunogenic protein
MKKLAFALASATALVSAPALAADLGRMPVKAPAYVAAAPMLWNGFYIGGQVGYQWGTNRQTEFVTGGGATGIATSWNADGVVGGVHAGYNLQAGAMVFGLEGDIEGSGVRGNNVVAAPFTSTNFESRWQASLRGRLGVAWGPTLLYATGGVAFADLHHIYFVGTGPGESFNGTQTGWTLGAGLEYAFSPAWSARVEYRYTDFGRLTDASLIAAPGFTYRNRDDFHTVRLGVSYRFGGGPVVASY